MSWAQKSGTPKGYKHLASGIDYKIVKDAKGKKTANNGDIMLVHMLWKANDSVHFDSRITYNDQPFPYQIGKPQFPADPVEVLKMLTEGDSVVILVPVDSFKKSGQKVPGNGDYKMMEFDISVVAVKTQQELKDEAAAQKIKDDSLIQDYLKRNKIQAKKTNSGLYYVVEQEGTGEYIRYGQIASVLLIGKTLDGKVFDANTGPEATSKNVLDVEVGRKHVLKGWNEGFPYLKKGSKATFYIPSHLAFGVAAKDKVPPNSVIISHVEVQNVKDDGQKK
jgi:FKBP-type peptidyl-prolyl cis-trans isomerase